SVIGSYLSKFTLRFSLTLHFVFFYWFARRADLRSFPTRRSSYLGGGLRCWMVFWTGQMRPAESLFETPPRTAPWRTIRRTWGWGGGKSTRLDFGHGELRYGVFCWRD